MCLGGKVNIIIHRQNSVQELPLIDLIPHSYIGVVEGELIILPLATYVHPVDLLILGHPVSSSQNQWTRMIY